MSRVNPDDIPFKNSTREKQRLQGVKAKNAAIAQQENMEESNLHLQLSESQNKNELLREKKCRNPKKRDFDELQGDYALLKLLKKGKITDKEFDEAMGFDFDDTSAIVAENNNSKQTSNSALEQKPIHDPSTEEGNKHMSARHKGFAKTSNRKNKRRGINKKLRRKLI